MKIFFAFTIALLISTCLGSTYILNKNAYDAKPNRLYRALDTAGGKGVATLQERSSVTGRIWDYDGTTIKLTNGSNICLDLWNNKYANSARVGAYKCSNTVNQKWLFTPVSNGSSWGTIRPRGNTNYCLDAASRATAPNTLIIIYWCGANQANQLWSFDPIEDDSQSCSEKPAIRSQSFDTLVTPSGPRPFQYQTIVQSLSVVGDTVPSLLANGFVFSNITNADGSYTAGLQPFTNVPISILQSNKRDCDILHLDLGPLNLNLLGLVVNLQRVLLDIIGATGAASDALGSLLCGLVAALAGIGSSLDVLGDIVNVINAILAGVIANLTDRITDLLGQL